MLGICDNIQTYLIVDKSRLVWILAVKCLIMYVTTDSRWIGIFVVLCDGSSRLDFGHR